MVQDTVILHFFDYLSSGLDTHMNYSLSVHMVTSFNLFCLYYCWVLNLQSTIFLKNFEKTESYITLTKKILLVEVLI